MSNISKSYAWSSVAGVYWRNNIGDPPSKHVSLLLTEGVETGDNIAVVGGSTKSVIDDLIEQGRVPTVFDFSSHILKELVSDLPILRDKVVEADVSSSCPEAFKGQFDLVISDRLFNRMDRRQLTPAFRFLLELLVPGGVLRATVRLGLYKTDLSILAAMESADAIQSFIDPVSFEVCYAAVPEQLLAQAIPNEIKRSLYANRGAEVRLTRELIRDALFSSGLKLTEVSFEQVPDSPPDFLLTVRQ